MLGGVNFAHSNELLSGVTRYSSKNTNWEIIPLHYSQESALKQLIEKGKIKGLIGNLISDLWIKTLQTRHKIAVVNTSNISSTASSVTPDNYSVGKQAAEHFIRRHYTSLFYAGIHSFSCNQPRLNGFRQSAAAHKLQVHELPNSNLTSPLYQWKDILKKATKPIGLFCVDDLTARRVIILCKQAKLKIPEDIAIIGVGNSQLDSFFAGKSISSINIPYATIGFEAALLLDNQLKNKELTSKQILVQPEGITLRETTGAGALNTLIGRAINYIESHLSEPISSQDIANHIHASKRHLEMQFQKIIGRSPHAEITHLRMTKARQLLKSPHNSIANIAIQCGYPEPSHFYARFKQHHNNIPPGKWRKQK